MMTPEEERQLFKHITQKKGNVELAKKRIISENLKLVVLIAKRYRSPQRKLIDLLEVGNLALMKAFSHYDYRGGYRFSTYAIWEIRNAIQRYVKFNKKTV